MKPFLPLDESGWVVFLHGGEYDGKKYNLGNCAHLPEIIRLPKRPLLAKFVDANAEVDFDMPKQTYKLRDKIGFDYDLQP